MKHLVTKILQFQTQSSLPGSPTSLNHQKLQLPSKYTFPFTFERLDCQQLRVFCVRWNILNQNKE